MLVRSTGPPAASYTDDNTSVCLVRTHTMLTRSEFESAVKDARFVIILKPICSLGTRYCTRTVDGLQERATTPQALWTLLAE